MSIKHRLKQDYGMKILIQEFAVMLVFISLIYKQSILSFFLYIILLWYTIKKFSKDNPMSLVRYFVVFIILLQYAMALTNLSSYNSPKAFPDALTFDIYANDPVIHPFSVPVYPS
jgi:multisubunit Na+/H+ antiporter MnhE subunit